MEKKKFTLTDEYKQNAFTVPDGYFDAIQDRLTERIAAKLQPQLSWWRALRPQLAFAAGFVALIVAGYGGFYLLNNLKESPSTVVYYDDLYAYAADMLNIDENTVLQLMAEDRYEDSSVDIDTDAIINYLADARISLSDVASLY
jgi:malate synthase